MAICTYLFFYYNYIGEKCQHVKAVQVLDKEALRILSE